MSGELVIDRGATSGDNQHFWVNGGALEIKDVTLKGGYSNGGGGAMTIYNSGTGIFTNVLFRGNTATTVGGAVYIYGSASGTFISCSWSGNSAANAGDGCPSAYPYLSNSDNNICYSNSPSGGGGCDVWCCLDNSCSATSCTVQYCINFPGTRVRNILLCP